MSRKEYLERLEILLQDIPENERKEALDYYTGYFADAGEGEEANVIRTLGSPESVAATIKNELNGYTSEMGSYSNDGYQNESMQAEHQFPEFREIGNQEKEYDKSKADQKSGLNIGLLIALIVLAFPIGLPVLGVAFAMVMTVIAVVFSIVVALGATMTGSFICGLVLVIAGISKLFVLPAIAIWLVGVGLLMLAVSLLMFLLCFRVFGKFIPWLIRGLVELCRRPFLKRGRVA